MAKAKPSVAGAPASRPDLAIVSGLFLVSFALRLWPVFSIGQSWEDAYFYIELARSLAQGKFELLGAFHTKYLPGYPAAVLCLHTLGLGLISWFKSAQLVSAFASAAVSGLCYFIAKDLTQDRRAGLAAGIIAALNAHLVTFSGVPFSECLFAGQVVLCLFLAPRRPLLAGLVAGFAGITRHEGLLLAPVFIFGVITEFLPAPKNGTAPAARREPPFGSEPQGRRLGRTTKTWPRHLIALALMLVIVASWWLLARHETGRWLSQIYTDEIAERGPTMHHPGVDFFLLSFPVAGHLATLFALAGLVSLIRSRQAWPLLCFFLAYSALHAYWMFGVERYFVPLVPLVSIMAGAGLINLEAWAKKLFFNHKDTKAQKKKMVSLCLSGENLLPGIAFLAGLSHLIGFAPPMIKEETIRTKGYLQAIDYVAEKPGEFSILAYDVFMVGYHDGKHPVIPFGALSGDDWGYAVPQFFVGRPGGSRQVDQGLRWIIWSDFYPADREKLELQEPDWFVIEGTVNIQGQERDLNVKVVPDKTIRWVWSYPEPGWLKPWRNEVEVAAKAEIYRLELAK